MITIRTLGAPVFNNNRCHVSSSLRDQPEANEKQNEQQELQQQQLPLVLTIQANYDGVAWRGLHPLLFEAHPLVARRAKRALIRHFRKSIRRSNLSRVSEALDLHTRKIPSTRPTDVRILPPQSTSLQYAFEGRMIRSEHIWLSMHTLSAWIATLGGGYFLCRHLSTAVFLAKQQRAVALWMGDYDTADRCTLNEAFNYIHSGSFVRAHKMILAVQKSASKRQDALTLRMVTAASLFLQRVKRASKRMERATKDDTVDDFQRIRLFRDRSSHAKK